MVIGMRTAMSGKAAARLPTPELPWRRVIPKQHARRINSIITILFVLCCARIDFRVSFSTVFSSRRAVARVDGSLDTGRWHRWHGAASQASKVPMYSLPDEAAAMSPDVQNGGDCATQLRVSSRTKVGKLGRVLSCCAKNGSLGTVYLQCTGPTASFVALQSVITANLNLPNETDTAEIHMVALPSTVSVIQNGTEYRSRRLDLQLKAVGTAPAEAEEDTLKVGQKTNCGKLAGAVLKCVEKYGEAVMATIGGEAVSQALVATMIAQNYTDQDPAQSGRLVLLPTWYNDTGVRKGVKIRCFKL